MARARLIAATVAAKAAGLSSRFFRRGGGTSLPGKVLLKFSPDAIGYLSGQLSKGSTVLSATNGKTTTANMAAAILEQRGETLVHNRAGANLTSGVATALLDQSTVGGRAKAERGLFEVDEAALPAVTAQLKPQLVVLANLFRDQLDRYGELDHLAELWRQAVDELGDGCQLVLNADDPLIADIGRDLPSEQVTWFGIEDRSVALKGLQHAADSKFCRRCGVPYDYQAVFVGHLGHYVCPSCARQRPPVAVAAHAVSLGGIGGSSFELSVGDERLPVALPLPGLYNIYNAVAAAACCRALGLGPGEIKTGLERSSAAFGRVQRVRLAEGEFVILLIKNPTGANEVIRTIAADGKARLSLLLALNDGIADGRDVSWIWDADFEQLVEQVDRVVCSGRRAADMAVRLKYAGLDSSRIALVEDLDDALSQAVAGADGLTYVLPTYTALLELSRLLARRGVSKQFWSRDV